MDDGSVQKMFVERSLKWLKLRFCNFLLGTSYNHFFFWDTIISNVFPFYTLINSRIFFFWNSTCMFFFNYGTQLGMNVPCEGK